MTTNTPSYSRSSQPAFDSVAVTNKLSAMFRAAARPLGFTDPVLKQLQTTFMYFIDDIQRGPAYDCSKMSIFVLHWVQRIENALKITDSLERQKKMYELINTEYTHNNFYMQN